MRNLSRICFAVAVGCAAALVLAHSRQQRLPEVGGMVPAVFNAPRQTAIDSAAFSLSRGGMTYTVTPLYAYEISGLVVSLFNTATWWNMYHKEWKDRLNIKDVCLIWGDNISRQVYPRMKFSSTSFECRYETRDAQTWRQFDPACLSNNHLLPADAEVERTIRDIRRGDQIFLRGYLVSYERGPEFKRGSSTTRADNGAWSCETIYVTSARILKPHQRFWVHIANTMKILLAITAISGFAGYFLIPPGE